MIAFVRFEAYGNSLAEVEAQLDAIASHVAMAGFCDGIVPPISETTDEHYDVLNGEEQNVKVGDVDYHFHYRGRRKVSYYHPHFGDAQRPKMQPEYTVLHDRQIEFAEIAGDKPVMERLAEPAEGEPKGEDVTKNVIVLRRRMTPDVLKVLYPGDPGDPPEPMGDGPDDSPSTIIRP